MDIDKEVYISIEFDSETEPTQIMLIVVHGWVRLAEFWVRGFIYHGLRHGNSCEPLDPKEGEPSLPNKA